MTSSQVHYTAIHLMMPRIIQGMDHETTITPRSFNRLMFKENEVTKSSNNQAIYGEMFFYKNIPNSLQHLFPKLKAYSEDPPSFTVERIQGITLSTMLVRKQITCEHIEMVIHSLKMIHKLGNISHCPLVYENHREKVEMRFKSNRQLYESLGLTESWHFERLLRNLRNYEHKQRALPVSVIHGDPVLTNIILNRRSNELKFIDMRGAQGTRLTTNGDAIYDLAKLLQSLLGYDLIIGRVTPCPETVSLLSELLIRYWNCIMELYVGISKTDIITVCCGLVTSLIPLHDNTDNQKMFARMSRSLLDLLEKNEERDFGTILLETVLRDTHL